MCGINGFDWREPLLIEKMNSILTHRGPDDQDIYADDEVSLGVVRLSIIDLSVAGRQPMSNEDDTVWITYNGEVYNFMELRKELEEKGHKFKSNTDTEVVLHAYEEWGKPCVERFNGMWAFAVYDKNRNLFFLSRDRFGIKPLYYYYGGKKFIFSSEIKGILQHDIDRIPNKKVIYEYLAFNLLDHSVETFFKNVHRLMPGENLIYDISEKTLETSKWYDLKNNLRKIEKPENEVEREIRVLFTDSVHYRLIADVPVGSCLSGGIDSSSIACTMSSLGTNKIKTFSLVFPGLGIDETFYIDEIVRSTNVEPYKISPSTKDLINDLHDLIWTQEEPFGSLSIYGQYKVMQLAHKNGMKVLLDGQGGDELLAGYSKYYKYYLLECLMNLEFKEFIRTAKVQKDVPNLILFLGVALLRKSESIDRLMKKFSSKRLRFLNNFYNGEISLSERRFNLNQVLSDDLTRYSIPQLLRYEDKNSMRWSIESRVPFLDYRFVGFIASLLSRYKIREGITKYAFRKSMEGVVPQKIIQRQDKIGFATPDSEWFRTLEFIPLIKDILDSTTFKSRKYWNHKEVKKMFQDHVNRKNDHSRTLWRIINTELWLRIFIDEPIQRERKWTIEKG